MPLTVQYVPDQLTSPKFGEAFAKGSGGELSTHYKTGDWAGFCTPEVWPDMLRARDNGFNFYYGDHGYFGRHQFYRITKNALQHDGRGHSDCERFRWFGIEIKPRRHGSHIVICPQSEVFFQMWGINRDFWLQSVKAEIQKYSDRQIIVRTKRDFKSFHQAIKNAHAVVCFTSNAAVDAILEGVPAICLGECAASIMAEKKIENIENPYFKNDRLEWAGVLADNQWTLNEIRSGDAWEQLNAEI